MKAKRKKTEELEIQGSKEQQIRSCPPNANLDEKKINKIMPARVVQGNKKEFYKYSQEKKKKKEIEGLKLT